MWEQYLLNFFRDPDKIERRHLGSVLRALAACAKPGNRAMDCVYLECRKSIKLLLSSDLRSSSENQESPKVPELSEIKLSDANPNGDSKYTERDHAVAKSLQHVWVALVKAAPRDQKVARLFRSACRINSPLFRFVLLHNGPDGVLLPSGGDLSLVKSSLKELLKTSAHDQRIKIIDHLLRNYQEEGLKIIESVVSKLRSRVGKTSTEKAEVVSRLNELAEAIEAELNAVREFLSRQKTPKKQG